MGYHTQQKHYTRAQAHPRSSHPLVFGNTLASKRLMISPTRPRATPSGLIIMKVCSLLAIFATQVSLHFSGYEASGVEKQTAKTRKWRIAILAKIL